MEKYLRLIKEVEPPKPSTRLSGSESLPSVAAQRNVDPTHLDTEYHWRSGLGGDEGAWRRSAAAAMKRLNGLAEDIRRHLSDEPVTAGPPSTRYRMLQVYQA